MGRLSGKRGDTAAQNLWSTSVILLEQTERESEFNNKPPLTDRDKHISHAAVIYDQTNQNTDGFPTKH